MVGDAIRMEWEEMTGRVLRADPFGASLRTRIALARTPKWAAPRARGARLQAASTGDFTTESSTALFHPTLKRRERRVHVGCLPRVFHFGVRVKGNATFNGIVP